MMLQPADTCIRLASKLRLIVDPSARSYPVTLVETYVPPSRSSTVTAEPDADVDDSSAASELSSEPHPATPKTTSAIITARAADQRVGRIVVLIGCRSRLPGLTGHLPMMQNTCCARI